MIISSMALAMLAFTASGAPQTAPAPTPTFPATGTKYVIPKCQYYFPKYPYRILFTLFNKLYQLVVSADFYQQRQTDATVFISAAAFFCLRILIMY
jgi:hypothetical protein